MNQIWNILVQLVILLLKEEKSFISFPTKITMVVEDDVRSRKLEWRLKDE